MRGGGWDCWKTIFYARKGASMSEVTGTITESVDPVAASARAAMQDAFRSDVERDLTRGAFDPTAHSRQDHSKSGAWG